MKLRTIIEQLNESIIIRRKREDIKNKSFLILCQSEEKTSKPDYMRFSNILWLVSSKDQQKVITVNNIIKCSNDAELISARQNSEKELISKLFDFMNGDLWEFIINGRYKNRQR